MELSAGQIGALDVAAGGAEALAQLRVQGLLREVTRAHAALLNSDCQELDSQSPTEASEESSRRRTELSRIDSWLGANGHKAAALRAALVGSTPEGLTGAMDGGSSSSNEE